jgi:predicted DCC family thiol-disulfide oxidoreductase YuxK
MRDPDPCPSPSHRERPVLVFDGDCGFCTTSVRVLERIGPDAEIVAWQMTDLAALGVSEQQAGDAVQWVEVDGTVRSGHEAIAAALGSAGRIWRVAGRTLTLPGLSWIAAKLYRLIADNRHRLPGGTPACERDVRAGGSSPPAAPRSRSDRSRGHGPTGRNRRTGQGD